MQISAIDRRSYKAPASPGLSWQALPAKLSDEKIFLQARALAELPGRGILFWQFANPFGV